MTPVTPRRRVAAIQKRKIRRKNNKRRNKSLLLLALGYVQDYFWPYEKRKLFPARMCSTNLAAAIFDAFMLFFRLPSFLLCRSYFFAHEPCTVKMTKVSHRLSRKYRRRVATAAAPPRCPRPFEDAIVRPLVRKNFLYLTFYLFFFLVSR